MTLPGHAATAAPPTGDPAPAGSPATRRIGGVVGQITWSLLGILVAALAQWLVIVVLARYGNPAMIGQYALGLAVAAPVTLVAGLALRTVQVTDAHSRFSFDDYLRLRLLGMTVATVVVAVVATFVGPSGAVVVLLVGIAKALDGVGDIYLGLFQRHGRMKSISLSMIVNGVATVLAVTTLLVLTGSVAWAVVGSVAGSALGAVVYCVVTTRSLRRTLPPDDADPAVDSPEPAGDTWSATSRRLAALATLALPLGVASGLASFTVNLPRYLVGHQLGTAALGIFAAIGYVVLAANAVFAAVAQTMLPRMSQLYASNQVVALTRLINRLVLVTLLLGALAVGAAAILGRPALNLVYGAPYARHASVLTLLTVVAALSGAVFIVGTALSALHRFGNQFTASVATLLLTALAGALLIPRYGLDGAAWTVVLTVAGDGTLKALMLRRALRGRSWT
ncbi:O-antigen/teichoic acid export membrane protein [Micromonospora pisi]|uniref:O-antigen/teichoic acid export membrane protein n=1 Tax=Micromonospora pisi TaxID=589240 RepID=A0A495JRS1_9ACTN|nr:lipopolysaccharide biosynthesis protein [Micromonospora pisi]RKR91335.1 O-antigen/teichoic acid export membrane protein [Micromonospora pisi]